jgi:hypothetical protein
MHDEASVAKLLERVSVTNFTRAIDAHRRARYAALRAA